MIKEILLVGSGSFLGGIARYLVALAMKGMHTVLPWATLTANIAGCFFDRRILGTILQGLQQFINESFSDRWFLRRLHNVFSILERERHPVAVGQLYGFHPLYFRKYRIWNICCHGRLCIGQINSGSDDPFRLSRTSVRILGLTQCGAFPWQCGYNGRTADCASARIV